MADRGDSPLDQYSEPPTIQELAFPSTPFAMGTDPLPKHALGDLGRYGAVPPGWAAAAAMGAAAMRPRIANPLRVYQGGPHRWRAERLVRTPEGEERYITGHVDQLPDVPTGHTVIENFPLGRFRADRVGTGEGNSAYGYAPGGYWAQSPLVAEDYSNARWRFGRTNPQTIYDRLMDPRLERGLDNAGWARLNAQRGFWERVVLGSPPRWIINEARSSGPSQYGPADYSYIMSLDPDRFRRVPGPNTSVHEANLHARPEQFLDFDRPLPGQPGAERIQSRIGAQPISYPPGASPGQYWLNDLDNSMMGRHPNMRRQDLQRATTDFLLESGVPGIRYRDALSRGPGDEPTHNFAVFDPSLIEPTRRYRDGGKARTILAQYGGRR